MLPRIAHAQDSLPVTSTPLLPALSSMHEMTQQLIQRLTERSQQVKELQIALQRVNDSAASSKRQSQALSAKLEEVRSSLEILRAELKATLSLLDKSTADYKALSAVWETFRSDAETQIADTARERDTERARADRNGILAIILGALAGAGAIFAGGHLLGVW